MEIVTLTGIAASVFTAIALIPQLVKLIKEKKAQDISMGMLISLFIGLSLWTIYGFMMKDFIILISNIFSLIFNILTVVLSIKYKGTSSK